MENILYYKKQIVIVLSIFILFLLASVFIYYNNEKSSKERKVNTVENIAKNDGNNANEEKDLEDDTNYESTETDSKYIYVDVKGYVSNPGVYKLKKGTIVNDVLIAAGGIKENADTICVNLSKKLYDEMVIYVHSKDEIKQMEEEGKINKDDTNMCPNIENASYTPLKEESKNLEEEKESESQDTTLKEKININTSDIDTLTTLPNIGKSKAQSIISYREKNGNFKSIEDIINVSGIGESTFEKIKDYITI